MTQIITNGQFSGENRSYTPLTEINDWNQFDGYLEVASDIHPSEIIPHLKHVSAIRVLFPSSADGRGSSIGKALRRAGFAGSLRAAGHVLADQYPLMLRSGFDDVEIDVDLAARQPEAQWADSLKRVQRNYLDHLNANAISIQTAA